jgi:hypothetical protein
MGYDEFGMILCARSFLFCSDVNIWVICYFAVERVLLRISGGTDAFLTAHADPLGILLPSTPSLLPDVLRRLTDLHRSNSQFAREVFWLVIFLLNKNGAVRPNLRRAVSQWLESASSKRRVANFDPRAQTGPVAKRRRSDRPRADITGAEAEEIRTSEVLDLQPLFAGRASDLVSDQGWTGSLVMSSRPDNILEHSILSSLDQLTSPDPPDLLPSPTRPLEMSTRPPVVMKSGFQDKSRRKVKDTPPLTHRMTESIRALLEPALPVADLERRFAAIAPLHLAGTVPVKAQLSEEDKNYLLRWLVSIDWAYPTSDTVDDLARKLNVEPSKVRTAIQNLRVKHSDRVLSRFGSSTDGS